MFRSNRKLTNLLSIAVVGLMLFTPLSTAAVSSFAAFEATHEIVCECTCGSETQTYEFTPNYSCSNYDDIPCEYNDGSTSFLSDCTKKAQPKEASASVRGMMTGSQTRSRLDAAADQFQTAAAVPIIGPYQAQPYPLDVQDFNIPTGDEYLQWLDTISISLFGGPFDGMILEDGTILEGQTHNGTAGSAQTPFVLDVDSIDKFQMVSDYVDPDSNEVFDLEFVWLRGTISAGRASETTGSLAVTAIHVVDPSFRLTAFYPYGELYPYEPGFSLNAVGSGFETEILDAIGFIDDERNDVSLAQSAVADEPGDACQGCKNDANKEIGRIRRDFKSCLKWGAAATLVGGLVGALGGPAGAAIGAIAGGGIAAGACADSALDKYGDVITDFCECYASNDCGSHSKCDE